MNRMKKAALGAGILCLTLILPGCASAPGKGRGFSLQPLAIVSAASNYDINWDGEETVEDKNGDFLRRALKLQGDGSLVRVSKADELITEAEQILRDSMNRAGIFGLADRDRVLGAAAYAGMRPSRWLQMDNRAIAGGYKLCDYRDKGFISELCGETGVGSLLFVNYTFTKKMANGIAKYGNFRAMVEMSVVMVDPAGKIVYRQTFSTHSLETTAVSGGAYSQDELLELFRETIAALSLRFTEVFTGPVS